MVVWICWELRVQFLASQYIMRQNRRSKGKVMTIWVSQELSWFIFERLEVSWASHIHPSQKLWLFEFSESLHVQFRESWYIMSLNRKSEWKVMTILISRELPLFNIERLNILCAWIGHPSEKLWPFEFLESFRCSISSVSIYYVPESDIRVKFYDHSNFSRASVIQFLASG